MHIELKLSCNCKPINRITSAYDTDIIAMPAFWREGDEVDYTLPTPPAPGETYKLHLHSPLSIDLYQHLWIYYEAPNAYYNGIDTAEDIEGARFCYGQIRAVLAVEEHHAVVEFKVEKSLSHTDVLNTCDIAFCPEDWSETFLTARERDRWVAKYAPYYVLSHNVESDLGKTAVAIEEENGIFIFFMYDWMMHEQAHYAGKYLVNDRLKAFILEKCEVI